tara:strand:+ start:309 stop:650 length:342 start_codon:yes stop_codon:yes gene_type:complete
MSKTTETTESILNMESMLKSMGIDLSTMPKNNREEIEKLSAEITDPLNMNIEHVKRLQKLLGITPSSAQQPLPSGFAPKQQPKKRTKIGANTTCPCLSGKKYKKCCRSLRKKL